MTQHKPSDFIDCDPGKKCPWVSCRYHLGVNVVWRGRIVREVAPVEDMEATCALQVANQGPHTLQEIAAMLHCTVEAVRQQENAALHKLQHEVDRAEMERPADPCHESWGVRRRMLRSTVYSNTQSVEAAYDGE